MNVAALFSGGKDSAYAIYLAEKAGLNVKYIVSLFPKKKDSYMFHSVNIDLTELLAEAMNKTFVKRVTHGEKEQELQDLKKSLENLEIDGVISGAIASKYQKNRIGKICEEIGIESITPLWGMNQDDVLIKIIETGFEVIIVGVSAEGLDESWLGRKIDEKTISDLIKIREIYQINEAGEGGEFESLVLDGPIFNQKLVLDETKKEWKRDHGVLIVEKAHLK